MTDPLVLCDVTGGLATLTLNRPEKLNALTPVVFEELAEHLTALAQDSAVRCLVLTGAGRSFCAGHDLSALSDTDDPGHLKRAAEIVDQLEAFPQPTIGKIRGHCMTGGLELALGCDLIVAGQSAQFADTHGKWGLAPVWGMSVRLPERVGRSKAKEISFTSRRIDGRSAADMGLADHCAADDRLDDAVEELAAQIISNSAGTNRIYKSLFAHHATTSRAEALQFERELPFGMPEDFGARIGGSK